MYTLEKYLLTMQLPLVMDINHFIIQQSFNTLTCFNEKLHKILGKSVAIRNINLCKLSSLIDSDISLIQCEDYIHCGKGYNKSQIDAQLKSSKNVVIFKCPFMLYSRHVYNTCIYDVVINYINNNPKKLYLFGNKRYEIGFYVSDVYFLDDSF